MHKIIIGEVQRVCHSEIRQHVIMNGNWYLTIKNLKKKYFCSARNVVKLGIGPLVANSKEMVNVHSLMLVSPPANPLNC